jgi:hypothetical protein
LTPSKVIVSVLVGFKRKRVFTPVEIGVPSSTIEASMVAFPLPQLLTLPIEAAAVRPFTRAILERVKLKNVFANLIIGRAPFNFPTLIEDEEQLIKAIIGGRSR